MLPPGNALASRAVSYTTGFYIMRTILFAHWIVCSIIVSFTPTSNPGQLCKMNVIGYMCSILCACVLVSERVK